MMETLFQERPPSCYSDLTLDRLLVGELDGKPERLAVLDHLTWCASCRDRRAELQVAQMAPPEPRSRRTPVAASSWNRRAPWGALLLASCAAIVLLVVHRPAPHEQAIDLGDTQLKGDGLVVEVVARRHDTGRVEIVSPGSVLRGGDAIRFRLRSPRPGYLTVLGIDGSGTVSRHVPLPGRSPPFVQAGETTPDGSLILDRATGDEQIILAICDSPSSASDAFEAARRWVRETRNSARMAHLEVACLQARFPYQKEP
jgi:Domain of unknown function (DUF4384)